MNKNNQIPQLWFINQWWVVFHLQLNFQWWVLYSLMMICCRIIGLGAPLKEKEANRHRPRNRKIKMIRLEQFLNSRRAQREISIHLQLKNCFQKVLNCLRINFEIQESSKTKRILKLFRSDQFQVLDCKFHRKVVLREGKLNPLRKANLLF